MGVSVEEERPVASTARRWHLVLKQLGTGIAVLIFLYIISNFHLHRVETLIEVHRAQLEAQRVQLEAQRIHLDQHAEVVRRGLFDILGGGGASKTGSAASATATAKKSGGLLGSIGSGISGLATSAESSITSGLTSEISNLSSGAANDLVVPAKYMGVGLASGALAGMNMTVTMDASLDPNPTGLNGIAMNLGSGLTKTVVSSLPANSTGGGLDSLLAGGADGTVGQASLAFAQGLGSGTANSLKLNTQNITANPAYNTSGVNGIAGNFAAGLTTTLLANVSLSMLSSSLPQTMSMKSVMSDPAMMAMLADAAAGLGIGLGSGSAVGLGLQSESALMGTISKRQLDSTAGASSGAGIKMVTQNFAAGLTSSFLQNGTVNNIKAAFATGGSLSGLIDTSNLGGSMFANLDVSKVATGFAVGMVSGAGSVVPKVKIFAADTSSFNDSVGGAATGFGNGLGSEGAYLVSQFFNLGGTIPPDLATMSAPAAAAAAPAASTLSLPAASTNASGSAATKRRFPRLLKKQQRSAVVVPRTTVAGIDIPANITNATDIAGVIASVNATALDPIIQVAIDDLTCTGVGGFAAIGYGLFSSGTLKSNNLNSSFAAPNQTFQITSDGNTYRFNGAEIYSTTVNGVKIVNYIVTLVFHIVPALLIYFQVVPLLMLAHSQRNISMLCGGGAAMAPAWQRIMGYSVYVFAFVILITGIVARGNATHFNTSHAVVGLIVILQTIAAGVLRVVNAKAAQSQAPPNARDPMRIAEKANWALFILLAPFLLATGFGDLSTITLCAIQTIAPTSTIMLAGGGIATPVFLLQGALIVEYGIRKKRGSVVTAIDQNPVVEEKEYSRGKVMEISGPYLNE